MAEPTRLMVLDAIEASALELDDAPEVGRWAGGTLSPDGRLVIASRFIFPVDGSRSAVDVADLDVPDPEERWRTVHEADSVVLGRSTVWLGVDGLRSIGGRHVKDVALVG